MKKIIFISIAIAAICCQPGCCKDPDPANCSLVPDPGLCEAYIPRYYYDQQDGQCKEFIWGGCGGVVPFETMAECEACGCND